MPIVTYVGDPIEARQAEERGHGISRVATMINGVVFPLNVPVDASDLPEEVLKRLRKSSHYVVDDGTAPEEIQPAGVETVAVRIVGSKGQKRGTVKAKTED